MQIDLQYMFYIFWKRLTWYTYYFKLQNDPDSVNFPTISGSERISTTEIILEEISLHTKSTVGSTRPNLQSTYFNLSTTISDDNVIFPEYSSTKCKTLT